MFSQAYPYISKWVTSYGWIEIGRDDFSKSFIRALDIGGMIWEGEQTYPALDDALQALEMALAAWFEEQGDVLTPC